MSAGALGWAQEKCSWALEFWPHLHLGATQPCLSRTVHCSGNDFSTFPIMLISSESVY